MEAFYLFIFLKKDVLDVTGLGYALTNNHDVLPTGQFLIKCLHACEIDLITLGQAKLASCTSAFSAGQNRTFFTISLNFLCIEAMKDSKEKIVRLVAMGLFFIKN